MESNVNNPVRAVSYLRVSSVGQIDGDGLDRQRDAIADYITKVRPKKIFLVHGDDDAVDWFRAEVSRRLPESQVVVPLPGEEHAI